MPDPSRPKDLRWTATLRLRAYVRATAAGAPALAVLVPVFGAFSAFLGLRPQHAWSIVLACVLGALVVSALMVALLANQLRTTIRAAGGRVQRYVIHHDTLRMSLGQDTVTLPVGELQIVRQGGGFLLVRRRLDARRRSILYFDDPQVVPRVAERIRATGGS